MTTPDRPTAAGVFVVRDPDVCAALEQLLAPHRTEPAPAPAPAPADTTPSQIAALMADAEARAAELTGEPTAHLPEDATIEQLLDHVHLDGQSLSKQDLADARDAHAEISERLRIVEVARARAERDLDDTTAQLKDALAKVTDLETDVATAGRERELADGELNKLRKTIGDLHDDLEEARKAPPAPRATGSRLVDKRSFTALADRMDNQARTQPKDIGDVLRLAARAVRDEVTAVYGPAGKKAS
ncbi:MAG: hypothetical protein ACK4UY_03965 [Dietzia sp.]